MGGAEARHLEGLDQEQQRQIFVRMCGCVEACRDY